MIIEILKRIINKLGFDIIRYRSISDKKDIYSDIKLKSTSNIIDIDALGNSALLIPGMIPTRSGQFLYALCYFQTLQGDIVEIGSWQGRSTTFLGMAARNSNNGRVFAVDHFKGNIGEEKFYRIKNADLSDLKPNFISNMQSFGLHDTVKMMDMSSEKAANYIEDQSVRFLFIDGDHSKEGVQKDINLFLPKLKKDSIIVFDDFSNSYQGLIEAVDSLISRENFSRLMTYDRTLVLLYS